MIGALKSLCTVSTKTNFNAFSSDPNIAITLSVMYLNRRRSTEADEIPKGFNQFDLAVRNYLTTANVEWGNVDEARWLFEEMPGRNEVFWTTLISGLMKCGRVKESMWHFWRNAFHNVMLWTAAISGLVQNGLSFDDFNLFKKLLESGVIPNSLTFVFRGCFCVNEFSLGISMLRLVIKAGFEHRVLISNSLITLFLRMDEVGLVRGVFG